MSARSWRRGAQVRKTRVFVEQEGRGNETHFSLQYPSCSHTDPRARRFLAPSMPLPHPPRHHYTHYT
ncbi:hypothetical protein E2C01_082488 [Portunus trituberculatus]|uniref:Uncharacterized protein n=1 Tax=Portunus trituberculatus TaxID=210409 RepID=A0A5B7J3Z7_PORTR|nr:hypothetical protein [Portunus trituberculatus]